MTITPQSAEFDANEFYADLGEVPAARAALTDNSYITINGKKYTYKAKDISVGNNGHIKAPIFEVNANSHLLVSNLYLAIEAKNGVSTVAYNGNSFKVTLDELNNGSALTVKEVKGVNTQNGRKNDVSVSGNTITEVSNNGRHMIAVTLQSNGTDIVDPNEVVYSLGTDGNLGMTSSEASGNDGVYYTYGIYMKYKNGDYTAEDVGTKTLNRKLIVPEKGSIDLIFVLKSEEYK